LGTGIASIYSSQIRKPSVLEGRSVITAEELWAFQTVAMFKSRHISARVVVSVWRLVRREFWLRAAF